jgi:galactarate dehydratase
MSFSTNMETKLPVPPVTIFDGLPNLNGGFAGTRNILGIVTSVKCVTEIFRIFNPLPLLDYEKII